MLEYIQSIFDQFADYFVVAFAFSVNLQICPMKKGRDSGPVPCALLAKSFLGIVCAIGERLPPPHLVLNYSGT